LSSIQKISSENANSFKSAANVNFFPSSYSMS
jgi:hypothetical protein